MEQQLTGGVTGDTLILLHSGESVRIDVLKINDIIACVNPLTLETSPSTILSIKSHTPTRLCAFMDDTGRTIKCTTDQLFLILNCNSSNRNCRGSKATLDGTVFDYESMRFGDDDFVIFPNGEDSEFLTEFDQNNKNFVWMKADKFYQEDLLIMKSQQLDDPDEDESEKARVHRSLLLPHGNSIGFLSHLQTDGTVDIESVYTFETSQTCNSFIGNKFTMKF